MSLPGLRPGSLGWLLRHDLRLAWRDLGPGRTLRAMRLRALLFAAIAVGLHTLVWPLGRDVADLERDALHPGPLALAAVSFLLLLMLAQTINSATKLLFLRGDLELLLASPIPPRRILAARALAIACGAFASAGIFVLPVADDAALQGHGAALALYPAQAGGAFATTALGLIATFALFRLIGPRRTRVAAQALAALIGALFALSLQVGRLMPGALDHLRALRFDLLAGAVRLPLGAATGDPGLLAAWLAGTAALFCGTVLVLGEAFAASVGRSGDGAPSRPRRRGSSAGARFGGSATAQIRMKERRLILRDPWLVSQVMMQILYMLPMGAALWTTGGVLLAVAPTLAVVGFQVASALAWLSLSGEDAPDLLDTAPVSRATLRRGKLGAVASLTAAVVGAPLVWLSLVAPLAAAASAGLVAFGLVTATALQLWHVRPGRRSAFAARYRESRLVSLIEMMISMLFGLTAALAAGGSVWALAPLGTLVVLTAALVLRLRRLGIV